MRSTESGEAVNGNDVRRQLERARELFGRHEWTAALSGFLAVQELTPLASDDLYALADCAWWLGRIDESLDAFESAYKLYLDEKRPRQAAVSALNIGYTVALRGEQSIGSAWLNRAVRILEHEPACIEHGYLVYIDFETAMATGDLEKAGAVATQLTGLAGEFENPDLKALAILAQGRLGIRQGNTRDGLKHLDEAMLAALKDDMEPSWAGHVYCQMMILCHQLS